MCDVCGCGNSSAPTKGATGHAHEHEHEHEHVGPDGVVVRHVHVHPHEHEHDHQPHSHDHVDVDVHVHVHDHVHDHDHVHEQQHHEHRDEAGLVRAEGGPAASLPGAAGARVLRVQEDILARNDALASANRARFARAGTFVVNLMSSPGSGKTTLLTRTLGALAGRHSAAVIEGDQQTSLDAERIRRTGAPAVQINTGRGCHLDAGMVGRALDQLPPSSGLLFIENVGNLVCPAGFDLGEHRRVVVVSVTEGEDKPLKYPDMFSVADAVVVNKVDLLPHLAFDVAALEANLRRLKPGVPIFRVSSTTGAGLAEWVQWLEQGAAAAREAPR